MSKPLLETVLNVDDLITICILGFLRDVLSLGCFIDEPALLRFYVIHFFKNCRRELTILTRLI